MRDRLVRRGEFPILVTLKPSHHLNDGYVIYQNLPLILRVKHQDIIYSKSKLWFNNV